MTEFKMDDHFDISGTQIGILIKCIDDMGGNFGDNPDDVWEWGRARDVIENVLKNPICKAGGQ